MGKFEARIPRGNAFKESRDLAASPRAGQRDAHPVARRFGVFRDNFYVVPGDVDMDAATHNHLFTDRLDVDPHRRLARFPPSARLRSEPNSPPSRPGFRRRADEKEKDWCDSNPGEVHRVPAGAKRGPPVPASGFRALACRWAAPLAGQTCHWLGAGRHRGTHR